MSQVYDLIVVTDEFGLLAEAYRGNLILHGGIAIPFSRGSGGRAFRITDVWGQHQGQGEQNSLIPYLQVQLASLPFGPSRIIYIVRQSSQPDDTRMKM